jgi:hypothetical protein
MMEELFAALRQLEITGVLPRQCNLHMQRKLMSSSHATGFVRYDQRKYRTLCINVGFFCMEQVTRIGKIIDKLELIMNTSG